MDTNVTDKRNRLLNLLNDIASGRNANKPPEFSPDLVDRIERLTPDGLVTAISASFSREIRQATAGLILAILLDTTFLGRKSLLLTLESLPTAVFISSLLEAMQEEGLAEGLRTLGTIATHQLGKLNCDTRACIVRRYLSVRTLLHLIDAYRA